MSLLMSITSRPVNALERVEAQTKAAEHPNGEFNQLHIADGNFELVCALDPNITQFHLEVNATGMTDEHPTSGVSVKREKELAEPQPAGELVYFMQPDKNQNFYIIQGTGYYLNIQVPHNLLDAQESFFRTVHDDFHRVDFSMGKNHQATKA